MKKAVLFDLDNTLYDYDTPHKKALKAVYLFLKKELNISLKKFTKLFNLSRTEIRRELSGTASSHNRVLYFQRLIEKTHNTVEPTIILKLYNIYWDTFLKNTKIKPSVLNTLKILKQNNFKTAVASNMTAHIQLRKIKKLKLTKYIDYLVTSEEAGTEKPHFGMFLLTLNKLSLLPEEVLFVGDNTIADIEGANAIGIDTVLIKNGTLSKTLKEDYRKPNYTIKKIPELLKILNLK